MLFNILIVFLSIIVITVSGFLLAKLIKHKSLYPLLPFRYDFRKRRVTFSKALELLNTAKAKVIIETGTSRFGLDGARSQGAATIVFGTWAKHNNAILHSVDISDKSVAVALLEVEKCDLSKNVKIHHSDSIDFLEKFQGEVDFLYLDSYDYSDDVEVQKMSQLHHLNEFIAIEKQLHKNTIVLIDDCALPGGGKGKKVVGYMQGKEWKIIINEYQILLVHKDSSFA